MVSAKASVHHLCFTYFFLTHCYRDFPLKPWSIETTLGELSYWVRRGVLTESPFWRVKLSLGRIEQLPRALTEVERLSLLSHAGRCQDAASVPRKGSILATRHGRYTPAAKWHGHSRRSGISRTCIHRNHSTIHAYRKGALDWGAKKTPSVFWPSSS